jgi:hypothetical protein
MKRRTTLGNGFLAGNHTGTFEAVLGSSKRKIPRHWKRSAKFCEQLCGGNGRRAHRSAAHSAQCQEPRRRKGRVGTRAQRRDGKLTQTGFRPKLEDLAEAFLNDSVLALKKLRTRNNGRQAIRIWKEHLEGMRLHLNTAPFIQSFREKRLAQARSARAVNIDTVADYHVAGRARLAAGRALQAPRRTKQARGGHFSCVQE